MHIYSDMCINPRNRLQFFRFTDILDMPVNLESSKRRGLFVFRIVAISGFLLTPEPQAAINPNGRPKTGGWCHQRLDLRSREL